MTEVNVNLIILYSISQTYSKDIQKCLMMKRELRKPIKLGEMKHTEFYKDCKVSYRIDKVATSTHIYEFVDGGKIVETNRVTKETKIYEDKFIFQAIFSPKIVWPKSEVDTTQLFGLSDTFNKLLQGLNDEVHFMFCLFGPKGCGKQLLLRTLDSEMDDKYFVWFDQKRTNDSFTEAYRRAELYKNDVVFCIPDFDLFDKDEMNVNYIKFVLKEWKTSAQLNIKVIITCADISLLDKDTHDLITDCIAVNTLNAEDRHLYMKHLIQKLAKNDHTEESLKSFAESLYGYSAKDIEEFIRTVYRNNRELTLDQLQDAKKNKLYEPQYLSGLTEDFEKLTWSEIGGYEEVKQLMIDDIQTPILNNEPIPRGILLHGPPGCSKTMFARALATECGINMFALRPSNILRPLVGASEEALKRFLNVASQCQPAIIFIDEIDLLLPNRGNGDESAVTERLLNELLVFLNGLKTSESLKVILMAATNRVDNVDEALIRPGRMEMVIEITLPNQSARQSILEIVFSDKDYDVVNEVVDRIPHFASLLAGKSGADIVHCGHKMKRWAMQEHRNNPGGNHLPVLTMDHVTRATEVLSQNDLVQQVRALKM